MANPQGKATRVVRVHQAVRRALARFDVAVTRYRDSPRSRRIALLDSTGVDTLVDIGANVGQYGTVLREGGYQGDILSFEPLQSAFQQLKALADRDVRWTCRREAVGDRVGVLVMNISENSVYSSALEATDAMHAADSHVRSVGTESVPMTTLDEITKSLNPEAVIGLKLDVQGFERQVMDGGHAAFERAEWVEMELALTQVYDGQMVILEALARMYDLGFELACVENLMPDYSTGRALQANGIFVRP